MNTIVPFNFDGFDRRKKKTHIAIQNAFIELLEEKQINDITVSELTKRADVNRKTFYNNYNSITDVFNEIQNNLFTYVFNQLPENVTINNKIEIYQLLYNLNKSFEPHKKLFTQLSTKADRSLMIDLMHKHLMPYITKCLKVYKIDEAVIPYVGDFILFGLSGIYNQWAEDATLTIEHLSLLSYNLIISALKLDNYSDIVVE